MDWAQVSWLFSHLKAWSSWLMSAQGLLASNFTNDLKQTGRWISWEVSQRAEGRTLTQNDTEWYRTKTSLLAPWIKIFRFHLLLNRETVSLFAVSLLWDSWDLPGDPVIRTLSFHCKCSCLIPGWRTKIPHAARHQKNKTKIFVFLGSWSKYSPCIAWLVWTSVITFGTHPWMQAGIPWASTCSHVDSC